MLRVLVAFSILFINSAHSSSIETVIIEGHNFPTEGTFTKKLKADYDIIQKRWIKIEENNIQLEAYHLEKNNQTIPKEFTFEGPHKNFFLNKDNIKYLDYGIPFTFVAYGILFWDWGGHMTTFNFRNEGWFGHNTYAGGMDKLAHMHSHYVIARAGYYLYRRAGFSHNEALKKSFILSSILGLLVEIGDGFTHYGFSVNDLIADELGVALGYLLTQNAYLNELIGFQIRWWNDHDSGNSAGANDPIGDYNNQKFLINIRMAAIPNLRDFIGTRYLNFDFGYYARGFKTDEVNPEKIRTIFVGASINMGQLINDLFPKSDFAYGLATVSRYYQFPYSSVEIKNWDDTD